MQTAQHWVIQHWRSTDMLAIVLYMMCCFFMSIIVGWSRWQTMSCSRPQKIVFNYTHTRLACRPQNRNMSENLNNASKQRCCVCEWKQSHINWSCTVLRSTSGRAWGCSLHPEAAEAEVNPLPHQQAELCHINTPWLCFLWLAVPENGQSVSAA